MKNVALAALLFLLPSIALGAGFAKDPIFLSRTPVTEGQSVRVYAVISNTDTGAFVGTLVFYDGDSKIGSNEINLAAGATQTASALWTPAAGTHNLNAKLVAKDGSVAEQVSGAFTIQEKPKPVSTTTAASKNQSAATIDSSQNIQSSIAGVSPQVASATEPAFNAIDNARGSVAGALDSQIASTKAKLGKTPQLGIVAGASTQDAQLTNTASGVWYWLYTVYLYVLEGLRWLIGNAGVFYPFIAIAFLYFIWRMFRRYRRPAY